MRERMAARGPDGAGIWLGANERIGLAHRRLAIIDLSDNGGQPMQTEDGRYVVSFNGEIYNHAELRAELIAKGYRFRSRSDTEVLLRLYAERGAGMVRDLRGMFAFALWDAVARSLLLARDPYGVKPLYYSDDGRTIRFASQVKALLAGGAVSRERDPAGEAGFYLFGSAPEPFTTYRSISAAPAGATIVVDGAGARPPRRYHKIAEIYTRAAEVGQKDPRGAVREALLGSVRRHLVADVPVGLFLSAGVDSGALLGLMRDAGASDIQTVTLGFAEFSGTSEDETLLAAEVASAYETRHRTRIVTREEFEADLPRLFEAMDQPTIDGVNTWFVSKAARELGLKVAISGLGGDELFGGYPSFRDVPRWAGLFRLPSHIPLLGSAFRRLAGPLAKRLGASPKAAGLLEYGGSYAGAYLLRRGLFMPWELPEVLGRDAAEAGLARLRPLGLIEEELQPSPTSAFARVATLESALYMRNQLLRDADWASMAHSLEVRTPLVDSALLASVVASGWSKDARGGKEILATAPSRPLPEAVTKRAKTGFATPVAAWMESYINAGRASPHRESGRPASWARDWAVALGRGQFGFLQ